jgi:hypothetical protein
MVTITPGTGTRAGTGASPGPSCGIPLPRHVALARDIAQGVVSLTTGPDGADPASLAWPLGLNAYMRRHGAGPAEVVGILAALRVAVLEAGGLDPATEPRPLPVADLTVQAVNAAVYLAGLIRRAAVATGSGPDAVVDDALSHLAVDVALSA